jgi:hypothetical protein
MHTSFIRDLWEVHLTTVDAHETHIRLAAKAQIFRPEKPTVRKVADTGLDSSYTLDESKKHPVIWDDITSQNLHNNLQPDCLRPDTIGQA